jgi:hypothetical protein
MKYPMMLDEEELGTARRKEAHSTAFRGLASMRRPGGTRGTSA